MTIRSYFENRKGAKVSQKNLQALANAHHALKAIADDAGVDLDQIPPALGGPDATEDENFDPYSNGSAGSGDATGSRSHVRIVGEPAMQRRVSGNVEVRG